MESLGAIQNGVRHISEVEPLMTSVERVMTYAKLGEEPGYATAAVPSDLWPTQGSLQVRNMSFTKSNGSFEILNDVSFTVSASEKVGVVGRIGSGVSLMSAALFCMPEPQGEVLIDGIDIRTLNIQAARRSMALVSKELVVFSGSLRCNLDPFIEFTDDHIWAALEQVQLKAIIETLPGQLGYDLKEPGTHFSASQRQLVCLARALLQKTKVLIVEEGSPDFSFKADSLVQDVIQRCFKSCTVLTISHRVHPSRSFDKLLIMKQGRVVEFDKPEVLIDKQDGFFRNVLGLQDS